MKTTATLTMDQALTRVTRRLHSLGPEVMMAALDDAGQRAIAAWRGNIQQGRSAAGKFKSLSPRYAVWKAKRFPGQPILRATGALYFSFAAEGTRNGNVYVLVIRSVGASRAPGKKGRMVRNVDKARWAISGQQGMSRDKRGRMKARKGAIAPRNFGEAVGLVKRQKGEFAVYRRPPRIFTALPRTFFLSVLTKHLNLPG